MQSRRILMEQLELKPFMEFLQRRRIVPERNIPYYVA